MKRFACVAFLCLLGLCTALEEKNGTMQAQSRSANELLKSKEGKNTTRIRSEQSERTTTPSSAQQIPAAVEGNGERHSGTSLSDRQQNAAAENKKKQNLAQLMEHARSKSSKEMGVARRDAFYKMYAFEKERIKESNLKYLKLEHDLAELTGSFKPFVPVKPRGMSEEETIKAYREQFAEYLKSCENESNSSLDLERLHEYLGTFVRNNIEEYSRKVRKLIHRKDQYLNLVRENKTRGKTAAIITGNEEISDEDEGEKGKTFTGAALLARPKTALKGSLWMKAVLIALGTAACVTSLFVAFNKVIGKTHILPFRLHVN